MDQLCECFKNDHVGGEGDWTGCRKCCSTGIPVTQMEQLHNIYPTLQHILVSYVCNNTCVVYSGCAPGLKLPLHKGVSVLWMSHKSLPQHAGWFFITFFVIKKNLPAQEFKKQLSSIQTHSSSCTVKPKHPKEAYFSSRGLEVKNRSKSLSSRLPDWACWRHRGSNFLRRAWVFVPLFSFSWLTATFNNCSELGDQTSCLVSTSHPAVL